jgi:hypothetical protein
MRKSIILFLLLAIILAPGCKKKDITKPTQKLHSPLNNSEHAVGGTLNFSATFEDNEELSQYKLEIHENFDDHDHRSITNTIDWEIDVVGDLSGKLQEVNRDFIIPANATPGWYHFEVKCIDAAGNESAFTIIDIKLVE